MGKVIKNKYVIFSILYWGIIGTLLYKISALGLCAMGTSDAIAQHYPVMSYIRNLWRTCFCTLLKGGHFIFPMVDFTVGMGEDTISALNYYGLGDPFYLLTMLSSQENLPYFYSLFFYFRVYTGGIAFMAFASELSRLKSRAAYIAGTFVYCFTGFTLLSNAHIIFVHAMFYIPLMMLGAERSMNHKRKGLLCMAASGFALSGFYFLYIGSVSLAVYVIYRLIVQKSTFKSAISNIGSLVAEYFLGLGLSAVILLPAIIGFLSSGRGKRPELKIVMSLPEILHMILNMFLPSYELGQTLGVCTIGMLVIICVVFAKKRKQEKINLLLLFITAIVPFVTFAMSGFGALYDRWEIVIDLYLAFLVVEMFDELGNLTLFQKTAVGGTYCVLLFLGKQQNLFDYYPFKETCKSYGILLGILLFVIPILNKLKKQKIGMCILFLTVIITINTNWRTTARDNDIAHLRERNAVAELLENEEQNEFYRVDNERAFAEPRLQMNISMFRGYNGTMQYLSISNPYYIKSFKEWDISSGGFNVYGLDQRTVMETMCAVKYFVVRTEFANIVPFGFAYVKSTGDNEWSLYENTNSLPIAFSYDSVYDIALYNAMNGLEKQSVMLHAAAVADYDGGLPVFSASDNDLTEGSYEIFQEDGLLIDGDTIQVDKNDILILKTRLKNGCENCLLYTGGAPLSATINIEGGYTKYGSSKTPIVINLGTTQTNKDVTIRLTFSKAMEISKKDIHIMYHDLSEYSQYIERLKEDTDGRFEVTANKISGEVDLESDRLLCFSVPYANGWHALIDGEETETYLVNSLFTGIEVSEGRHNVELYYITPGIRTGAAICAASLICIVAYLFYKKKS